MYYNFSVPIPDVPGKLVREKRGGVTYVKYEYDRFYDKEKKFTYPRRATIGKVIDSDPDMLVPNHNFMMYFPDTEIPDLKNRVQRSCCLKAGAYIVFRKIIKDYCLDEMLEQYLSSRDVGLLLDLAAYSICCENNAGQYYPDYAYEHPLFTEKMKVYSDSSVSDFLSSVPPEVSTGFLNDWNCTRSKKEKIYISYDSTNKNSQAGDVSIVEYGKPKTDIGFPVFNYSVGYDVRNREPLFYEKYPGSIVDVSQLKYMLEKAKGYGYRNTGFILDRGYFSRQNFRHMDKLGYSFIIMVKGMSDLVSEIILENKGTFESKRSCDMDGFGVYGKTVKRKLDESDEKERYFHIYHSISKEASERILFEDELKQMREYMMKRLDTDVSFGKKFHKYYYLHYKGSKFKMPEENTEVTEREISLCGYFVIITSEEMTAKEALHIYKSRDMSEKAFRGDKSYLGNKSMRVYSTESNDAKIFIEFIAMIMRNKIYTSLIDEMNRIGKKPNYMTVPGAIKELEKIEMSRQSDGIYRLDHAVTKTQKKILNAFGLNAANIDYRTAYISQCLKEISGLK